MNPKRDSGPEFNVIRACKACGVVLARQDRDHCGVCMPEELRTSAMAFREAGRARLEMLWAAGEDPAHSDQANRQRGTKVSQAQQAFRQWDAEHGEEAGPEVFRREILPGLQSLSLGEMAKVTGLPGGYCSFIRRGMKVPHRRHWHGFRAFADESSMA